MEILGGLINCDSLCIAKVTADSITAYTTAAAETFAKLGEVKNDIKSSSKPQYFDGEIAINHFSESGEVTITIPGISEKKAAEVIGKSYDSTKGVVFDNGKLDAVPYYALGYRTKSKGTDGNTYYKYRWFLKGQFSLTESGAKSATEDVDPQNQELTFTPMRTEYKFTYPDPANLAVDMVDGLKVSKTDTTDPAFTTEASWFSQVQTPLTFGAVTALSVTALPANNATNVLATATPTLTFSNKIAEQAITLVKYADNTVVTTTNTFDTAGKIFTITPSASLTAGAVYLIIVSGVTDVFNQDLATSIIKFTVAS